MKFKVLIILNLVSLILSLKSSDLCNLVEKECKGEYDPNFNYKINCEPISCHGEYSYECGDKCAKDKTTCSNYQVFRFSNQRNLKDIYSFLSIFRINDKVSFKDFLQNIPTCPERKYEFKLNHICLSGTHCYEKIKLYRGFKHEYVYRKMNCSCEGIYNYECNNSYCSINKKSCDVFTKILSIKNTTRQVVYKCGNDHVKKVKQITVFASRIKIF